VCTCRSSAIARRKEKVKKFLGKICRMVPSSAKDGCQMFVNTYGGAIVDTLVQGIDPSLVIYFCI